VAITSCLKYLRGQGHNIISANTHLCYQNSHIGVSCRNKTG